MDSFTTSSDLTSIIDKYAVLPNGRPAHLIDPKKKNKAWCLLMVKCAHHDFRTYCPNLFYNNSSVYTENVRYFQGLLNPAKYMDLYDNNQSETKNETSVARDKRILNIASKYIRILKGRLSDLKFDVTATPVNALARQHEQEYISRIKAAMHIKKLSDEHNYPTVNKMLAELGFDKIPSTTEELEIQRSNLSLPFQMAMGIEMFLNYLNTQDNLENKLSEADLDAILMGVYATETRINADGSPFTEKIDPRTLLVGFSNTEDFRDASEIGKYRTISVTEMKEEDVNSELSPEDYEDIERKWCGQNANQMVNAYDYVNFPQDFITRRALVLDLYFYSWDEEVKLIKPNRNGNPRVYRRDFGYYRNNEDEFNLNNPDKKLFRTKNQVVYKATWVVGTNYLYNWGLLRETARSQSDPYRTKLPILVYAPLIKDGQTHAMMDELKTIIDAANLKWQRIQETIAKARPPGLQIDMDALLAAVEAIGDKQYDMKTLLGQAIKENIHYVSGGANKYGSTGKSVVEELHGGLGPEFSSWTEALRSDLQLMQEITGYSSGAAGSPVKYEGKDQSANVMQAADFSTKHLYEAKRIMFENVCRLKTTLGMDMISSGKAVGIKKALGGDIFDYMQINSDASKYEYSISVDQSATDETWADIYTTAKEALTLGVQAGGISLDDYLILKQCTTIKQATAYLYMTIKEHKREADENQRRVVQEKAQSDQQSAKISAQMSQQTLQIESQLTTNKIQQELQANLLRDSKLHDYKMAEIQLEADAKSQHINIKGNYELQDTSMKTSGDISRLRSSDKGGQ